MGNTEKLTRCHRHYEGLLWTRLLRFLLDMGITQQEQTTHIASEKQLICQTTKEAERSFKLKDIDHPCIIVTWMKFMQMPDLFEDPLYHLIDETMWSIILANPRCQMLPNTKMLCLPGYCIA